MNKTSEKHPAQTPTRRLPAAREIKEIAGKIRKYFPDVSDDFVTKLVSALTSGQFKWNFLRKYPVAHAIDDDEKLLEYVTSLKKRVMKGGPRIAKASYNGKLSMDDFLIGQKRPKPAGARESSGKKGEIVVSSKLRKAPLPFLEHVVVHELAHRKVKGHDKKFTDLCTSMQPNFLEVEIDILWFLFFKEVMKEDLYS